MKKYFDRELSWLSFNYRVLQEAINPYEPLMERLKFLAIYSANLDEFYKVRVASLKHIVRIQKKQGLTPDPEIKKTLKKIKKIVFEQQAEFNHIFKSKIIPELEQENIFLVDQKQINDHQKTFLKTFFNEQIQPLLKIKEINLSSSVFVKNKGLYLAIELIHQQTRQRYYYLVNVPIRRTQRFIQLPNDANKEIIIQLSDVMRLFLPSLFPDLQWIKCYEVNLTRDAELYLEEEIAETVQEKISASLYKRKVGAPSRFLYDERMPKELIKILRKNIGLQKGDLIPGGRYHNFNDFFTFPMPDRPELYYPKFETLPHTELENFHSYFDAISSKDFMLHFPYQHFDYIIQFLEEAAEDAAVEEISITLYRVAKHSKICQALIKAAENGKKVMVFSEVKARFDEELNLHWADKMKQAGVDVHYSFEELKVHSKIFMITRKEGRKKAKYAYFGTGNFNEDTAKIYCDHALLTKRTELTKELSKVFDFLIHRKQKRLNFKHLLVAPFNMRLQFINMIDQEIANAKQGLKAQMILKMNSLEDKQMIDKLYEASNAGVKINIIVRGICCLIPGVENMSKNITVISIIDRYLEHGRIYWFYNGGKERLFLASADWMKRNLSYRVEVGFPVYDKKAATEIKKLLTLQLKDTIKARKLNKTQSNPYKKSTAQKRIRAQFDYYQYLEGRV